MLQKYLNQRRLCVPLFFSIPRIYMDFRDIQFKIIHFDQLDSTNIRAHELLKSGEAENGSVIRANYQVAGKGQRGRLWESNASENLMVSIVLKTAIEVKLMHLLNKMVANSIYDLLDNLSVREVSIKWPNDLLVNGKKIAGILIENSIQAQNISQSIIGIGLNVNQTQFSNYPREAISLSLIQKKKFEIDSLLQQLLHQLKNNLSLLYTNPKLIDEFYHQRLFGLNKPLIFSIEENEVVGTIRGVDEHGLLDLEIQGKRLKFSEREVVFKD